MAERTGLEPATSNVTGWRSNQLSYRSIPFGWAGRYGEAAGRAISFLHETDFFFRGLWRGVVEDCQRVGGGYPAGVIFREMELWVDAKLRGGPEAMAVDEWLLETRTIPMLRIYGWDGKWASLGYFGKLDEAKAEGGVEGVEWVRRWTGGGVVDHRGDWTYSLIVPRSCEVAMMKGGESYRAIHEILVEVLRAEGVEPGLAGGAVGGGGMCFENPVEYDVLDGAGAKMAGAAQRRTRAGLLHQGSVARATDSHLRGELFAESLAESWWEEEIFVDDERVEELMGERYGSGEWLARR